MVQNVSPLKSDRTFVVELLADGKPKTYRLAVEPITADGKTIERIVCADELSQLLNARPASARSFFRLVGNVYHGKKIDFPIDPDAYECDMIA